MFISDTCLFCLNRCLALSHALHFMTLWTVAFQALLPREFFRQEYGSGLPVPSLKKKQRRERVKHWVNGMTTFGNTFSSLSFSECFSAQLLFELVWTLFGSGAHHFHPTNSAIYPSRLTWEARHTCSASFHHRWKPG